LASASHTGLQKFRKGSDLESEARVERFTGACDLRWETAGGFDYFGVRNLGDHRMARGVA
jgi:hypothetical protein